MLWSISTWMRLILAATLVFAAFVVAPVADAATCGVEPASAAASIDASGDSAGAHNDPVDREQGSGKAGDHGLCAHGHCHQTSTARSDAAEPRAPESYPVLKRGPMHDNLHASTAPDGLKRPPRV